MHFFAAFVMVLVLFFDRTAQAMTEPNWKLSVSMKDDAHSNDLPVLLLGAPGWPGKSMVSGAQAYAWRSLAFETNAQHESGWSLGYLIRAEAELSATPDAVKIAGLFDQKIDPSTASLYNLAAKQKHWQGRGLTVQTPSIFLNDNTYLGLRFQWLQLTRLNTGDIQGTAQYLGNGEYSFGLSSIKTGHRIESPFMSTPDANGWGGSLGFTLNASPHPQLQTTLEAHDLISILKWRTGYEQASLNSNIQSRDAEGYLDYAAAVNGRREKREWTDRMSVQWRANMSWKMKEVDATWLKGYLIVEAQRKAWLNQYWLGWSNSALREPPSDKLSWRIAAAPADRALMAEIQHHGWHLTWRGDSLHETARLRSLYAGWRTNLN